MDLDIWMEQVTKQKEKRLSQITLENYVENCLHLTVVESSAKDEDFDEVINISATNGENIYVFEASYYQPESLVAHQNVLVLKEISGAAGVYQTNQSFWLKNASNSTNAYLTTPLAELIKGSETEPELLYVIQRFQQALKTYEGYTYEEKKTNDPSSFVIRVSDKLKISKGLRNTIQISYLKQDFFVYQFIYVGKSRGEVGKLITFIQSYLNWDVRIDEHSLSELYDFLEEKGLRPRFKTSKLWAGIPEEETVLLVDELVHGEWDTYHQLEFLIFYNFSRKVFGVKTNYCFKWFSDVCVTVEDVKENITKSISLLDSCEPFVTS